MSNDWKTYLDNDDRSSEMPTLGGISENTPTEGIRVRYLMANIAQDNEREMLEDVMNAATRCGGMLVKVGDVHVLREDSHFDREGYYIVAIKYYEVVSAAESTQPTTKGFEIDNA